MPKPSGKPIKYTYSFSSGAVAFLAFPWASYFVKEWGYEPYKGLGIILTLGIILGIAILTAAVDYLFFRIEIEKPVRSGIWWAAAFGPLVGFALLNEWNNSIYSRIIGFFSTIVAFALGYYFSKKETVATNKPRNPQIRQILSHIASELSGVQWVSLITTDGLTIDAYSIDIQSGETILSDDRISAMSAAMLSLGERIAKELNDGKYQYTVIAGTDGVSIVIALNHKYLLGVGLGKDISLDATFNQLRQSIQPLQTVLQNENNSLG